MTSLPDFSANGHVGGLTKKYGSRIGEIIARHARNPIDWGGADPLPLPEDSPGREEEEVPDHALGVPASPLPDPVGVPEPPEFAREPGLVAAIQADLRAVGIVGEEDVALLVYLTYTSRLLDEPLAIVTRGKSAGGKTTVLNKAAELFPPESLIDAMTMTPASLFNTAPDFFRHKVLKCGERKHSTDDVTRDQNAILRQLLSEKRITRNVSVYDKEAKKWSTENVVREGPVAYAESTTAGTIFEEDLNRLLQVYVDDSAAQTRAVMRAVAGRYAPDRADQKLEEVIKRHHQFQRALRPKDVRIPFWEGLADGIPSEKVEARRVVRQVFAVVETVALLHQFQREEAGGKLLAIPEDYEVARRLLLSPVHAAVGAGKEYKAVETLRQRLKGKPAFTATDVKEALGYKSPMGASHLLEKLLKAGLVLQSSPAVGRTPARYRFPGDLESQVLPPVGALRLTGE